MELLTASYRTWRPGAGSPVATSLLVPKWRPEAATWPRCWEVSPRWDYFKAAPAEFEAAYIAQLERYGVSRIMAALARIGRGAYEEPSDRLALICWETTDAETACHRRLFARWLLETCGERVDELT